MVFIDRRGKAVVNFAHFAADIDVEEVVDSGRLAYVI